MTLNYYKETLTLSNFNYYIELSNFINCKNANFGGAIFCENQESNLFITISLFYKCRVYNATDSSNNNNKESHGGCVYYSSSNSCYTNKCSQFLHSASDFRAATIYSDAKDFKCFDTSMDISEGDRSTFMMHGNQSQVRSLNISNIKVQYQVSGFITRCTDKIDIKFATLVNLSERAGCAMTFYLCEEGILQYSNVFNASSQNSFSLLMFGQGSHVNISNCVFQLNDYDSITGFYPAYNQEIINIIDCVFDSNLTNNFKNCSTQNITFTQNPTFIITSISSICKIRKTNCPCNAVDSHSYLKYIAIIMLSSFQS